MVRFTRTFHTVGQGAFYSEKIEYNDKQVFRMVYDCGSKSIPESLLAKRRHYKIFCVNVKYRIQNRVLYFLFYIFTPKE